MARVDQVVDDAATYGGNDETRLLLDKLDDLIDALFNICILTSASTLVGSKSLAPFSINSPGSGGQKLMTNAGGYPVVVYLRLEPPGDGTGLEGYLIADTSSNNCTITKAARVDAGLAPAVEILVPSGSSVYVDAISPVSPINVLWAQFALRGQDGAIGGA